MDLYKQVFVHKVWTKKKYDLLIAGDSRIYRGISTKPFEDELGVNALNLGFSSGQFEDHMFDLIDEKLIKNSGNRTIILGITPNSLFSSSYPNGHIRRIKNYKDEEVLEYLYLLDFKKYFGSVGDVNIHQKLFSDHQNNYIIEPKKDEGWIASDYHHRLPNHALKSYGDVLRGKSLDSTILENFYSKIEEWVNEGIEVYGFIPPSSPNIETLERSLTDFNDQAIIKEFINSGGKWIRLENYYQSYDGSHLAEKDALRLSKDLANKIKMEDYLSIYIDSLNYRNCYFPESPLLYECSRLDEINYSTDTVIGEQISGKQIWYDVFKISAEEVIKNKIKHIYFEMDLLNEDFKDTQYLVFYVKREGENVIYESLNLDHILNKGNWTRVYFYVDINEELQLKDDVKAAIYNIGNEISIKNIKVNYYQ
jgi:hypothetical protein